MLEANPNLTWRDVQHILATTAVKNGAQDSDWTLNGAGYHVNHKYLGVQLKSGQLSREGIQLQKSEVSQDLDSVSCLIYSCPKENIQL